MNFCFWFLISRLVFSVIKVHSIKYQYNYIIQVVRQPVSKILRALFDIKPVDDSGQIDLQKIYRVRPIVNLAPVKIEPSKPANQIDDKFFFGTWDVSGIKNFGTVNYKQARNQKPSKNISKRDLANAVSKKTVKTSSQSCGERAEPFYTKKQSPLSELEKYLNTDLNVRNEIKIIGGKTEVKNKPGKPRYRVIQNAKYEVSGIKKEEIQIPNTEYIIPNTKYEEPDENYEAALRQINEKIKLVRSEEFIGEPKKVDPFEYWKQRSFKDPVLSETNSPINFGYLIKLKDYLFRRNNFLALGIVGFFALIFTSLGPYGINIKNEIMKESNLAVANLERANDNLKVFDFKSASNNFADAYEEFSKAGESLNFVGANITSLFAELPGAGKLKSAKNIVEAGKLLAEAGKSMSEAVSSLSKTGVILKLTTSDANGISNVRNIFGNLKKSLLSSKKNLSKAGALLSEVGLDALPEDKRESFSEFMSKLPKLEGTVSDAVEYTSFLENLLGSTGVKKYIVLFQNNSELRPTGGFPGTYAVVTFKDGRLAGILIDDVYNLDGQLKENIIPPKPLQHITPNWGMRDANWFIDFSVSAQKIMEFFKKEAGYEVDGVITMSPRMISDILKVVGPIEMPEYGYAVNDDNFLSTIQAEVEYGDNREQPKRVVVDMAPKLLEKIYSSDPGKWLDIFNVFISGLDKKDILMYFRDLNLEQFVAKKGFGGLVKNTDKDYLMFTLTNVKGSKTDRVTDNAIVLNSKFGTLNSKSAIIHKLTIMRQHNGGSSKYGFYNKQNPAYVRVLVPEGSELLSISGNSDPGYKPLISYSGADLSAQAGFRQDENLFKFESGFNLDSKKRVSVYRESGKTGFAFWLITDPGKNKAVELEYAVPLNYDADSYGIYIQKQPGLEVKNFEFKIDNSYIYSGEFNKDLELRIQTK